jgi:hypothetical protein
MSRLILLKELEDAAAEHRQNCQKAPFVSSGSASLGLFQKSAPSYVAGCSAQLNAFGIRGDAVILIQLILTERDQRNDSRHLCLECRHLRRFDGLYRCQDGHHVDSAFGIGIPADMVSTLHRCRRFSSYKSGGGSQ